MSVAQRPLPEGDHLDRSIDARVDKEYTAKRNRERIGGNGGEGAPAPRLFRYAVTRRRRRAARGQAGRGLRAGAGELGKRVIEKCGRHWLQSAPGIWQPVHPLARLRWEEAIKPTRWCAGFRARLSEEDEARANAAIPFHMMPDLQLYSLQRLSKKRRQHVRSCLRTFDLIVPARLMSSSTRATDSRRRRMRRIRRSACRSRRRSDAWSNRTSCPVAALPSRLCARAGCSASA